jgi:hypothetical protein
MKKGGKKDVGFRRKGYRDGLLERFHGEEVLNHSSHICYS